MQEWIEKVIREEWEQFQMVNNRGGRASCQDDPDEFHLMRKSQFLTWPEEILVNYYADLIQARIEGRNLIFEKYAYMMKETEPAYYEELRSVLPVISQSKQKRIERIVEIQMKWAEEFQSRYPAYASSGRPVYASEAGKMETSSETYLRGELCSYGEETVRMYESFVSACLAEGRNLTYEVRQNMAQMYGYDSVELLEKKMKS